MKIMLICLLTVLLSGAQAPTTTYAGRKAWIIKAAGTTTVTTWIGGKVLKVTIHTWQVPVHAGPLSKPRPYTQCTYSQNPCSLTDWVHIQLGNASLFVSSFAIAGMGDMHYLSVSGTPSRLVLSIGGGDAASSYDARLIFKGQQLVERMLYGLDPQHPFEVSHYYPESFN